MVLLRIPTPLRPLCGGASELELDGHNIRAVLQAADARCPGLWDRLVEDGRLRSEIAIALDGDINQWALFQEVQPTAELTIVPAIGGG